MSLLRSLRSGLETSSYYAARITGYAIVAAGAVMIASLMLQVLSRYVAGRTFVSTGELTLFLLTWLVLLGASLLVREDGHVRFNLVADFLPQRIAAIWQRLVLLFVLAFCLLLTYSGAAYLEATMERFSATAHYPREWLHLAAPVSGLLGCLHALARLLAGPQNAPTAAP